MAFIYITREILFYGRINISLSILLNFHFNVRIYFNLTGFIESDIMYGIIIASPASSSFLLDSHLMGIFLILNRERRSGCTFDDNGKASALKHLHFSALIWGTSIFLGKHLLPRSLGIWRIIICGLAIV